MGATSSTPLPPSQDPFYTAPFGWQDTTPGTILRSREVPDLAKTITNASAAYQYVYRTTDSKYLPSWAVTTYLIPENPDYDCANLLSYQIPYDSADVDASPSYSLYPGNGNLFGDGDISLALGKGWFVNTPDYEGPNASFTAGVISGHATIDSVRAVLKAPAPQVLSNPKYALWGYSGGALASEWALELQNQYAPEMKFVGAALGGLTPNVTSVLYSINGTVYAGLAPAGILGLASQYPEAMAYLEGHLNPTGEFNRTRFNKAKNYTLVEEIGAFAGQNIGAYFDNGLEAIQSPIAQYVIDHDGIMGYHGVPQPPVFAYKAIHDEISVVADTDKLVNEYCGIGATINYQRNTVGSHLSEEANGRPAAVMFLEEFFAGTFNQTGCVITNVTVGN